jgi:pSer/pThr/pTyr-binding forkhead associated (FHA) protein
VLRFPLHDEPRELVAGTIPDNDIYLPYKGVSRRHFLVFQESGKWRIKDLGSTNGTILNGQKIQEAEIHCDDVIQAGSIRLDVEAFEPGTEMLSFTMDEPPAQRQTGTEDLREVITEHTEVYSFPNLIFPHGTILGTSPAMFDIYQKIQAASPGDLSILLVGETGSGKEVLARNKSRKERNHASIRIKAS